MTAAYAQPIFPLIPSRQSAHLVHQFLRHYSYTRCCLASFKQITVPKARSSSPHWLGSGNPTLTSSFARCRFSRQNFCRGYKTMAVSNYAFPQDKLRTKLEDDSRIPLVLVSCGSFSPITYLHLRMFEMAQDWVKKNTQYEVVGGYLSPVADAYKKQGLVNAEHRLEMCRLATHDSDWIMVDDWEAVKEDYTRSALVLDHINEEVNNTSGGIKTKGGEAKYAQVALLSGADLLKTMSEPGVWATEDLDHIFARYGAFIIERSGTDLDAAMSLLEPWRKYIYTIPQLIQNDVSSTKIRQFLGKDMSIRYLIPEQAFRYIDKHSLFKEKTPPPDPNRTDNTNSIDSNTKDGA